jgi:RNA polymerase sigma-70 factor (ECF subfamily)
MATIHLRPIEDESSGMQQQEDFVEEGAVPLMRLTYRKSLLAFQAGDGQRKRFCTKGLACYSIYPPMTPEPESPPNNDMELVARTQGGDPTAFDELVVKYSPRLYGLVYHMTSNHEDTNDLLQDIFSKAYRSITNFRGKSSFYTWMHSIAVNMTINFLKKRNRRQHPSLNDPDSRIENDPDFIAATSNGDPTKEVSMHELQKKLNAAMMKLSEDHRMAVTMFDIQGIPHAEIAKILKVSEGTVRSRLFYAHRQLQNSLHEFKKN